jgi:hypothetical protein
VLLEHMLRRDVGGTDGGFEAGGFAKKHCWFPSDGRTLSP